MAADDRAGEGRLMVLFSPSLAEATTGGICASNACEREVLTEGTPAEIVANEDVRRVYLGDMFS
jgi:hypothetical protein